jgi:hypothetical protein
MPEPAPHRPPDNSVRVALSGVYGDSKWVNRFWLNVTPSGTPTPAQILGLSNAVSAAFRTRFGPQLSTVWTLQTQRTVMFVSSTLEIGVDGSDTGSGTAAGSTVGAMMAYLINWSIAGTYRGGHPRTYLSGVEDTDLLTSRTMSTTKRNALTTAAGNFLADVNALTPSGFSAVALGTIRFFRANSALAPPVFEPYLAGSCAQLYASQRRRMGR